MENKNTIEQMTPYDRAIGMKQCCDHVQFREMSGCHCGLRFDIAAKNPCSYAQMWKCPIALEYFVNQRTIK